MIYVIVLVVVLLGAAFLLGALYWVLSRAEESRERRARTTTPGPRRPTGRP